MVMSTVGQRQLITLKCLSDKPNPNYVFLDGRTQDGIVQLVPDTDKFTGTHWELVDLGRGKAALKCLSDKPNPNYVFLDGRTQDGIVQLVSNTDKFTGTHWALVDLGKGKAALKCLSDEPNPNYVFLDGRTQDGVVRLAPTTDEHYLGTHWSIAIIPPPPVPSAFVKFNGHPDSYARVGDASDTHLTTNLTMEAMIRWHGVHGYAGCVISKPRFDSEKSSGTGYALGLSDGKPGLGIITASGANRSGAAARTPTSANVWTAVSVTYDGKRALTYVDGVEVGRQEWPNVDNIAQGSTGILIGREFLGALPERAFGGDLADVRIWNQALSAETIAAWRGKPSLEGHPNLGALVARWLFNEGQGTVAKDSSGHGHAATLANGAAWG
jgi:hypothetical protein